MSAPSADDSAAAAPDDPAAGPDEGTTVPEAGREPDADDEQDRTAPSGETPGDDPDEAPAGADAAEAPAGADAAEAPAGADAPAADLAAAPGPARARMPTPEAFDDTYRIELDVFEGPLDLLLHLIQKHELDIFDIPISFVTKKYLEYLEWMGKMQIDVASEYLVMAATLAYIKSRMLLPEEPGEADEEEGAEPEDPRAELVRRLLEYQKYKDAAEQLGDRPILDRDVFSRGDGEAAPSGPAPFAPVSVFKLFEAFDDVLRRAKQTIDHEVIFERIGIAERMVELTEMLHDRGRMRFEEFFLQGSSLGEEEGGTPSPFSLVITFLAMLEMARLGVARITQEAALEELYVEFAKRDATLPAKPAVDGLDEPAASGSAPDDGATAGDGTATTPELPPEGSAEQEPAAEQELAGDDGAEPDSSEPLPTIDEDAAPESQR